MDVRPFTAARLLLAALLVPATAPAQEGRPIPQPVTPEPGYVQAVDAGTRSADGSPGPAYWQQEADYRIQARLSPDTKRLEGQARIAYRNRSPDTLRTLYLHLHQNLHAEGTVRNEPQEVTGGVELARVVVDGTGLERRGSGAGSEGGATGDGAESGGAARAGWSVDATILRLDLPDPLPPDGETRIEVDYAFTIPRSGAGRMGWDEDLFYVGYWYPQMAVYDDVVGWQVDPYLGRAEFYMGYADYDVSVTLPEGWIVRATGTLRNPSETLAPAVRERLARADGSDSVVHVLGADDFGPGSAT
ncbi:MAG: M1 family peptidase, partial [Acidobacteriota bacterium]